MKENLQPLGQPEFKRSLNEEETLLFLQKHNIKQLKDFKPHEPLLYVFEESVKGEGGPFTFLPPEKRPSIARLHDPLALNQFHGYYKEKGRQMYDLQNEGGQVDLYAIRSENEPPLLVAQEFKSKLYHVFKEGLFESNDELFPLGKELKKPPR